MGKNEKEKEKEKEKLPSLNNNKASNILPARPNSAVVPLPPLSNRDKPETHLSNNREEIHFPPLIGTNQTPTMAPPPGGTKPKPKIQFQSPETTSLSTNTNNLKPETQPQLTIQRNILIDRLTPMLPEKKETKRSKKKPPPNISKEKKAFSNSMTSEYNSSLQLDTSNELNNQIHHTPSNQDLKQHADTVESKPAEETDIYDLAHFSLNKQSKFQDPTIDTPSNQVKKPETGNKIDGNTNQTPKQEKKKKKKKKEKAISNGQPQQETKLEEQQFTQTQNIPEPENIVAQNQLSHLKKLSIFLQEDALKSTKEILSHVNTPSNGTSWFFDQENLENPDDQTLNTSSKQDSKLTESENTQVEELSLLNQKTEEQPQQETKSNQNLNNLQDTKESQVTQTQRKISEQNKIFTNSGLPKLIEESKEVFLKEDTPKSSRTDSDEHINNLNPNSLLNSEPLTTSTQPIRNLENQGSQQELIATQEIQTQNSHLLDKLDKEFLDIQQESHLQEKKSIDKTTKSLYLGEEYDATTTSQPAEYDPQINAKTKRLEEQVLEELIKLNKSSKNVDEQIQLKKLIEFIKDNINKYEDNIIHTSLQEYLRKSDFKTASQLLNFIEKSPNKQLLQEYINIPCSCPAKYTSLHFAAQFSTSNYEKFTSACIEKIGINNLNLSEMKNSLGKNPDELYHKYYSIRLEKKIKSILNNNDLNKSSNQELQPLIKLIDKNLTQLKDGTVTTSTLQNYFIELMKENLKEERDKIYQQIKSFLNLLNNIDKKLAKKYISYQDIEGNNVLHYAAKSFDRPTYIELIKFLREENLVPNNLLQMKNNAQETPNDILRNKKNLNINQETYIFRTNKPPSWK